MAKQQSDVRERTRLSHDLPRMYRVIMHNDDFTTMEFVVEVLRKVFGKATVGLYTLDIAVSKSQKAMRMARDKGFPFKLTWEPEERDIPF